MKSHYDTLEVSPHASNAVIRAAYRCLVQHHHPDKNPQDVSAGQKIADFNQAYSILSNIEKRKKYDRHLGIAHISGERRSDAVSTFNERKFSETRANTIRPFAFRPLD
ncbi:J domain-containing protein [Hylemonella gracilis]|uniref:J domain-containing protein n=1 Tax=Hylemonella gracilis TaxID=80880 RepID=UPI0009DF8A8B|nr:J domain-containing protein [Hylemonella gracilis]